MTQKHDFAEFARILGVSESLLEFKWLKLAKPYVKHIPWEPREDELLAELMRTDASKKWTELALRMFESGVSRILRTAKQVRERWVNYIDPGLNRTDWTGDEDYRLLRAVDDIGRKWSDIGKLFKRTENNVKNRYNSLVSKGARGTVEVQTALRHSSSASRDKENPRLKPAEPQAERKQLLTAAIRPLSRVCSFRQINYEDLPSSEEEQD